MQSKQSPPTICFSIHSMPVRTFLVPKHLNDFYFIFYLRCAFDIAGPVTKLPSQNRLQLTIYATIKHNLPKFLKIRSTGCSESIYTENTYLQDVYSYLGQKHRKMVIFHCSHDKHNGVVFQGKNISSVIYLFTVYNHFEHRVSLPLIRNFEETRIVLSVQQRLWDGGCTSNFLYEQGIFSSTPCSDILCVPPSLLPNGYVKLSSEVKEPVRSRASNAWG